MQKKENLLEELSLLSLTKNQKKKAYEYKCKRRKTC